MKKTLQNIIVVLAAVGLSISLRAQNNAPTKYNEMTIAQLQAQMAAGTLTSVELTEFYLERIFLLDQNGTDGGVNSVIELNPDAFAMAQQADNLRAQGKVRGPLHGIPVLIKDNIDTGDKMQTTAGSFALFGQPAQRDSTIAAKLRAGGAVIWARRIFPSGRTSVRLNRPAAGQVAADNATIRTRSIAIRAAPAPARARPLRPTLSLFRWVAKRTAASFVRVTRMA
jgi:hypothetical protein